MTLFYYAVYCYIFYCPAFLCVFFTKFHKEFAYLCFLGSTLNQQSRADLSASDPDLLRNGDGSNCDISAAATNVNVLALEKEFECSVCLEEMRPPTRIYQVGRLLNAIWHFLFHLKEPFINVKINFPLNEWFSWQCRNGHVMCEACQAHPEVTRCPTCRSPFTAAVAAAPSANESDVGGLVRNQPMEKLAQAFYNERSKRTSVSLQGSPVRIRTSQLREWE